MVKYLSFIIILWMTVGLASCAKNEMTATDLTDPVEATQRSNALVIQPTISPTSKIQTATPTASASLNRTWETVRPGMQRRTLEITSENGSNLESIYQLRVDPAQYRFDVAYQPNDPPTLQEWLEHTGATAVFNGSYFSNDEERYFANGLIIIEGQAIGSSYGSFAGMLAITPNGPELRWLEQEPYDPNEQLLAGLQSFPLLVKPGGLLGFPAEHEDNRTARRTVIGQDHYGHVVFMIAELGYFTLHQLSAYLTESDLELDIAINLDGGPSSGLILAEPYEEIPAYSVLPIVITLHAR